MAHSRSAVRPLAPTVLLPAAFAPCDLHTPWSPRPALVNTFGTPCKNNCSSTSRKGSAGNITVSLNLPSYFCWDDQPVLPGGPNEAHYSCIEGEEQVDGPPGKTLYQLYCSLHPKPPVLLPMSRPPAAAPGDPMCTPNRFSALHSL